MRVDEERLFREAFQIGFSLLFSRHNPLPSLLAVCIDRYTELRVKQFEDILDEGQEIDSRLEAIVMRMFDRCLKDRRYKQAIGIAFETRHIDVLERALRESVSIC